MFYYLTVRSFRGAGSTFTRDARRAQLLRCAIQAIAEGGYASATLDEVARRAGVSKGVVSYHFEGKDDLFLHVVGDVYARADAAIRARVEAASGSIDVLDGYIEANLRFLASHPADVQAMVAIVSHLGAERDGWKPRPARQDPLVHHLEGLLRDARDTSAEDALDLTAVAVITRAAIDAAAGRLAADPAFDLDSYARALTAMVRRATA